MLVLNSAIGAQRHALNIVIQNIQVLEQFQQVWNQIKLPNVGDGFGTFRSLVDLYA